MTGATTGSGSTAIAYDPLGRLQQVTASSTTQYLYDGPMLVAEYDSSGTMLRRYVPGQGVDEPLVWYEGADLSSPHWLHTDQQGSVIAATNNSGTATAYAYSATGEPKGGWSSSAPAFRYTGQVAIASAQIYYYKARMYDPALGRFLQTDPVGYAAGLNLYAYAGNDPVNRIDPSGYDGCGASLGSIDGVESVVDTPCGGGGGGDILIFTGGGGGGVPDEPPAPTPAQTRIIPANRTIPSGTNGKTSLNKLWACTKAQYGFNGDGATPGLPGIGDLLGNALKAGSEIGALPVYKPLVGLPVVGGTASRFTNILNYSAFQLGLNQRFSSPLLRSLASSTFGSVRIATVLGRANVIVGAGLAAYDATSIAMCVANQGG